MDRLTRVVVRERNPTFMSSHSDYIHNFDYTYSDSYTSTTVYITINFHITCIHCDTELTDCLVIITISEFDFCCNGLFSSWLLG